MHGIDYLLKGRSGCITDPKALIEFYRRLSSQSDFKRKTVIRPKGVRLADELEIAADGVFSA